MATPSADEGREALRLLKSSEPTVWLAPSTSLAEAARTASKHLFSALRPFTPKSPFDQLLVDGFDAEQIWQQIDVQSQRLLASVRRDLKRFGKDPEEISKLKAVIEGENNGFRDKNDGLEAGTDDFDEELGDFDDEDDEEEEEEEEERDGRREDEDEENDGRIGVEEEDDEDGGEEMEEEGGGRIEDKFLKIKELEEFLEDGEEREYGSKKTSTRKEKEEKKKKNREDSESDEVDGESEDEEDEDDEEDDEVGDFGLDDDEDEDADKLENARYEDFFGANKQKPARRKSKLRDGSEESDSAEDEKKDQSVGIQESKNLSTHEKKVQKLRSEIEKMEKANLEPKTWTMQGEVTAARRPKNSALEVDLDFEHNVRPAPVITEEVTASLEEMIQKRILEGQFDDVQRAPKLPTKATREMKELDESKSKKGLGEIYEEEFVQKTNIAAGPLSFSDEMKKEASMLFKKLCLKIDALSHFHFAPKPVIEDMSIQENVPALAMEEIAPVAVSDAAMLAPEEVFAGKGDIKEEAELAKSERKRRRANKKRRYKAAELKRAAKKAKVNTGPKQDDGSER